MKRSLAAFLLVCVAFVSLALAGDLPDPQLTPGSVLTTDASVVCVRGYSKTVRNVPYSLKRQVYSAYGITSHRPGEYEVDHLISLELGGADVFENLWPESYLTSPWNAHVKDRLENELHRRVCAGDMTLDEAQRAMAGDWIKEYKRVFGEPTQ